MSWKSPDGPDLRGLPLPACVTASGFDKDYWALARLIDGSGWQKIGRDGEWREIEPPVVPA